MMSFYNLKKIRYSGISNFISRTNYSNNFKLMDDFKDVQKSRVIVLCSDIESILLHEPYDFKPK